MHRSVDCVTAFPKLSRRHRSLRPPHLLSGILPRSYDSLLVLTEFRVTELP